MKNIIIFLIIFMTATAYRLMASEPQAHMRSCMFREYSTANDSLDKVRLNKNLARYRKMRNTGAALTGVGTGLLVVGDALLWTSVAQIASNSGNRDLALKLEYTGVPVSIAGAGLLIPGIIMLVRGRKYYRRLSSVQKVDTNFKGLIIN